MSKNTLPDKPQPHLKITDEKGNETVVFTGLGAITLVSLRLVKWPTLIGGSMWVIVSILAKFSS